MDHTDEAQGDLDSRLESQLEKAQELMQQGMMQTATRIALESRRLARAEHRLIAFLHANFLMMNLAQNQLAPETCRDGALEAIALLESPDRARTFQADFPEGQYEYVVSWMSACAYDNLAVATASMQGYNSEGMQSLIAEGIHVCRRTGKLRCIACFREYATGVHRAADDLEMALHHARTNSNRTDFDPENDRRWVGAKDEVAILTLLGQLQPAWEAGARALELASTYHNPLSAGHETRARLRTICHLAGQDRPLPPLTGKDGQPATRPPRGEFIEFDLLDDLADTIGLVRAGQTQAAIDKLTHWDQWLTQHKSLDNWFEVRLRLIAACGIAGQPAKADALARQLEKKAQAACDYLTLRRLKLFTGGEIALCPVPPAAPYTSGPYAASQPARAGKPAAPTPAPAGPATTEPGPLRPVIDALHARIGELAAGDQVSFDPVVNDILSIDPVSVTHQDDAARLMHLLGLVGVISSRDADVWAWCEAAARPFPQSGIIINLLATVADNLRNKEGSPLAGKFSDDQLKTMFRRSLDLVSDGAGCFFRAARFYMGVGDASEAERCLARSFRLDRGSAQVTMQLSALYAQTGRTADALAVLDMGIREGEATPEMLWEAAVLALSAERHQSSLAYLDRFQTMVPQQPGAEYYRALCLLALSRPHEAAEAIEREATVGSPDAFQVVSVRAAVAAALKQLEPLGRHIRQGMGIALHTITELSPSGISSSLSRLWDAAQALPDGDPLVEQLRRHLLTTCMAPDALLESLRQQGQKTEDLVHFTCTLRQPLDERWSQWPGRLADQEDWRAYQIRYGVLAADAEAAAEAVLALHGQCCYLPAEVEAVEPESEGYHDFPGVTWQSAPEAVEEEAGLR